MPPIHADEVDRASGAEGGEVPARLAEKDAEGRFVHLARGHREGTMVDCAEATRMTVDRHVVGRVGKDHFGAFLAHQRREVGRVEGIAAQNAMPAEEPHISNLAERRPRRKFGNGIGRVVGLFGRVIERCDAQVDLAHLKTGELDAEVEAEQR
jgi:hypothetical protein